MTAGHPPGHGTEAAEVRQRRPYQDVGLMLGPLLALTMLLLGDGGTMGVLAWRTAAIGLWMAVWWATEAVPVAVTALLPLVLFAPLGIAEPKAAAAPYANPIIYLYLGALSSRSAYSSGACIVASRWPC